MIDTVAIVERNDLIASASMRRYGRLRLSLARPIDVKPGQFAMLKARETYEPLLRRAMAFYQAGPWDKANGAQSVEFIYQILGRGTQSLAKLKVGDPVDFLGSLGNTYEIEAACGREALLVAGGVGSAALLMLGQELVKREIATRLFIGGASYGDLCGVEDFIELLSKDRVMSATIDGSFGEKGFVTAPLEAALRAVSGSPQIIYACGPDAMLHRVSQIADQYEVPTQLSLESPMACGFGICVGCAVAVKADCPEGFIYQKVCTDGPVFWSKELHW